MPPFTARGDRWSITFFCPLMIWKVLLTLRIEIATSYGLKPFLGNNFLEWFYFCASCGEQSRLFLVNRDLSCNLDRFKSSAYYVEPGTNPICGRVAFGCRLPDA